MCPHSTPPSTINRPPPVPAQQNYQQIYHWQTELRNLKDYQIKQGRAITEIMEKLESYMTKLLIIVFNVIAIHCAQFTTQLRRLSALSEELHK